MTLFWAVSERMVTNWFHLYVNSARRLKFNVSRALFSRPQWAEYCIYCLINSISHRHYEINRPDRMKARRKATVRLPDNSREDPDRTKSQFSYVSIKTRSSLGWSVCRRDAACVCSARDIFNTAIRHRRDGQLSRTALCIAISKSVDRMFKIIPEDASGHAHKRQTNVT